MGALIAARRPRNPIGWILLAHGLLWMLSDVMDYYGIYGVARPGSVPFPLGVAGINDWLRVPYVGLLGTGDLRVPAFPQREATVREVAPPGLVVWGGCAG